MNRPLVYPRHVEDDPELQKLVEFYNETLGFCPNSIKTMHIRPRIAAGFIEMNKAVMENKGRVTSVLKRLIGYMSSLSAGCRYCQAHTIRAAERYGADCEQLENVWNYKTHPSFSESERVALDFATASSVIPNGVTDEIADNLRKYWDEGEVVEMLGVIALFGFLNRWNDSMGTELEDMAIESGEAHLKISGWEPGKHKY